MRWNLLASDSVPFEKRPRIRCIPKALSNIFALGNSLTWDVVPGLRAVFHCIFITVTSARTGIILKREHRAAFYFMGNIYNSWLGDPLAPAEQWNTTPVELQ